MPKRPSRKTVETLTHGDSSRKNIPTAEFRSVMDRSEQSPVQLAYQRRNRDLDPQLVWRVADDQNWFGLVVQTPRRSSSRRRSTRRRSSTAPNIRELRLPRSNRHA